ncbi:MAG: DUF1361 domain-containing protein [Sporolactobacillus sp.]
MFKHKKIIWKRFAVLYVCVYLSLSLVTFLLTHQIIHLMIIWNLFLAVLPFGFSTLYVASFAARRAQQARLWGMLWLFFFPNSPYLVTDFIHLQGTTFIYDVPNTFSSVSYSTALINWMSLIQIGIAVLAGTWCGMLSLQIVDTQLRRRWGTFIADLSIIIFCLISGYAVYIGRFLRLNSWDILHPLLLLNTLKLGLNHFAIEFSLMFASFIFMIYGVFVLLFAHVFSVQRLPFRRK